MMLNSNILVLDDEKGIREELREFFEDNKYNVYPVGRPSEAFQVLNTNQIDIAIIDIRLPEMDGISVLKKIKNSFPDIEVIMITGHGDMECAINAMREGAIDFFTKPFKLQDIQLTIGKTTNHINLNKNLKVSNNGFSLISKELEKEIGFPFISENLLMKTVVKLMNRVSKSSHTTVLITGESGTGKELVARGIHYLSSRKNNNICSVNCSTIPEELFESEFFGHKKGSFTNALADKKGWFEAADKGTLFLDEVADLKPSHQPKFLRVLESKSITRIGETKKNNVDVRIIAATNYDLKELVEKKKFRPDLYYRLNSFVINIPPLRDRKSDIPILVDHFIKEFSVKFNRKIEKVDKHVIEHLMGYKFPGNIRELKHMIENAVILCTGNKLNMSHFPTLNKQKIPIEGNTTHNTNNYNLEQVEKNTISQAFQECDFNKSKTAKVLNISRQALDRKLAKLSINIKKELV